MPLASPFPARAALNKRKSIRHHSADPGRHVTRPPRLGWDGLPFSISRVRSEREGEGGKRERQREQLL